MNKLNIPEDVMAEIKRINDDIAAAKTGLDHFASTLKDRTQSLWDFINDVFPETRDWALTLDRKEKTITKRYPVKRQTNSEGG